MSEIYQLPDNGNNNAGMGNIPFSIPIGGFGMGGGFGSSSPSAGYLKETLEEDAQTTEIKNKAE